MQSTRNPAPKKGGWCGGGSHWEVILHCIVGSTCCPLAARCSCSISISHGLARLCVFQSSDQLLRKLFPCSLAGIGRRAVARLSYWDRLIIVSNHCGSSPKLQCKAPALPNTLPQHAGLRTECTDGRNNMNHNRQSIFSLHLRHCVKQVHACVRDRASTRLAAHAAPPHRARAAQSRRAALGTRRRCLPQARRARSARWQHTGRLLTLSPQLAFHCQG